MKSGFDKNSKETNRVAIAVLIAACLLFLVGQTTEAKAAGFETLYHSHGCTVEKIRTEVTNLELRDGNTLLEFTIEGSLSDFSVAVDVADAGDNYEVAGYFNVVAEAGSNTFSLSIPSGVRDVRTYRIRRINDEGGCVLSVVKATLSETYIAQPELTPNPAQNGDHINLMIKADTNTEATWSLVDGLGKVISKELVSLNAGENRISIDTEKLNSGVYRVEVEQGGSVFINRIMIR